jgi:xylulokinase
MNLMDIAARDWSPAAVEATAPALRQKLPAIVPSTTVVGTLAPYWTIRHGWPSVRVVAWSGDNPCSLIGTGLVRPGRIAVSLGTSDTVFGPMPSPVVDASGVGHVFGAPTGDYMGLTCFQNGSLARERIRDAYGLDWAAFSSALASTPPGNGGRILLPWFEPEITPSVMTPGVRRFDLDAADVAGNVRGVVEGQMLAMARHSRWMDVRIDTIHATGGAAVNRDLLTVMADVFDADVYQCEVANSAALGAALRAFHADSQASSRAIGWDDIVRGLAEPLAASRIQPDPARVATYRALADRHAACERAALAG